MDVVGKLISGHQYIEHEDIVGKLVKLIDNDAFFWDNALKVSDFFDKEALHHLRTEEEVLLPMARKVFPPGEYAVVEDIQKDHELILKKIGSFSRIAHEHLQFPNKTSRLKIVEASREIIELFVSHARKEDTALFPLIRKYFQPQHYQELEKTYEEYLKK